MSELEKLTKERISKEEEGSLTDLRKKMMSLSSNVIDKGRSCETSLDLVDLPLDLLYCPSHSG